MIVHFERVQAIFYILIQLSLVFVVRGANSPGDQSPTTKYLIPSYYGSRELDFTIHGFAVSSNYSSFYWSHGVDMDDSTDLTLRNYYIIDSSSQSIKQVTANGVFSTLVSFAGGYRDGDITTSLFSGVRALQFFRQNKLATLRAQYKSIIVLQNDSFDCKTQGKSCQDKTLTQNSEINLKLLYEIYDIPSQITQPSADDFENPVLIIADTANSCIRKIDLITRLTSTLAGQCTVAGFKDGPFGTNLLTSPTSLGVDDQGIIFFYDSDSDYIRMIDPVTKFVSTLLKGACREDIRYEPKVLKQNFSKKRVICYKNWLNINGVQGNTYTEDLPSICQLQQSLCTTYSG